MSASAMAVRAVSIPGTSGIGPVWSRSPRASRCSDCGRQGRRDGALDEAELDATTSNAVVDLVEDGALLVVTFGYAATGTPQFELLGRLRDLERASGRALNKLLVRDPSLLAPG